MRLVSKLILKLSRVTFRTVEDADAWWAKNRSEIVGKLKNGPVISE